MDMQTAAGRYVDGLKPPYKGVAATIIGVSYRDRAQSVLCVGWATTVAAAGMKHTTSLLHYYCSIDLCTTNIAAETLLLLTPSPPTPSTWLTSRYKSRSSSRSTVVGCGAGRSNWRRSLAVLCAVRQGSIGMWGYLTACLFEGKEQASWSLLAPPCTV